MTIFSEGFALYLKALALEAEAKKDKVAEGTESHTVLMEKMTRLMKFSKEKLEAALLSIPDSLQTLVYLGDVEHWLAVHYGYNLYASPAVQGKPSGVVMGGGVGEGGVGGGSASGGTVISFTEISSISTEGVSVGAGASGVGLDSAETKGKDMPEVVRDYFVGAIKHLSQVVAIYQKRGVAMVPTDPEKEKEKENDKEREEAEAPDSTAASGPRKRRSREDRKKLISVVLKIGQVYCDWSALPLLHASRQARADRQDTLWIKAWQQFEYLISYWPKQARRVFSKDIRLALENVERYDLRYRPEEKKGGRTELAKGGEVIAALLKLEALRELTRREKLKDEAMRFKQLQADKKRRIEAKRQKMEEEAASSRNMSASSSGGESASDATTQERAVTAKKATSTPSLAAMLQESGPQVSEAMKKTTRGAVSSEDLSALSSKKSPIIVPSSHEKVDRKGEKEKEKEKEKEDKEKEKEKEKDKEPRKISKKEKKKMKEKKVRENKSSIELAKPDVLVHACTFLRTGPNFCEQPIYGCATCKIGDTGHSCLCDACAR